MPEYRVEHLHEIRRNSVVLDTSVLVQAFGDSRDAEEIRYFLDEMDVQWLVPVASIVEAWGQIVGSNKRRMEKGVFMLRWLMTPGKAVVLAQRGEPIDAVMSLITRLRIDVVDAMLMSLATDLTDQCTFAPPMHIASYDSDFYRGCDSEDVRMTVYSMQEAPHDPFEAA